MPEKKEIALMYSGGLDTTYAALQLAEEFDRVHLLTFCNGFCLRSAASRQHVCILHKKFGREKFEHSIISVASIFSRFKKGLLGEMLKVRSPLVFDLCCRLSMEVAEIFYCLEKGISYATDGNNPNTQGEMFLQQEKYLKAVCGFYGHYGIRYVHPYKHLKSRNEVIENLQACGIETGSGPLKLFGISTQLFTQPFCLWAPVAYLFTSRIRKIPLVNYFSLSADRAIVFRETKEKIAREIIDSFLSSKH